MISTDTMALKKHSISGTDSRFPHDVARHVQVLDRWFRPKKKGPLRRWSCCSETKQ